MTDSFYDPNSQIDPQTRYEACQYSLSVFHRGKVSAHQVDTGSPNSFLLGLAGDRRYLVYVRVTLEDEQEQGNGPMPGILIDTAQEMNAEPHVVRVHLRSDHGGTTIKYFGHDELEREFKRGEPWRRVLLRGKAARDYFRLVGGRLSKLELTVRHHPPGKRPEKPVAELDYVNLLLEGSVECLTEEEPPPFLGTVWLDLRVDTLTPELEGHTISMGSLVRSSTDSDEFSILTCDCGSPECAGIWRGIEVVHEDGLVVWRVRGIRPRRVVVFDRGQYRQEILSKVRAALALHKELGEKAQLGAGDRRESVERALYCAEEDQVANENL